MHVRVNAAMSVDGKLSTRERTQVEISGPEDFERVDALRAEHDAVMVGIGTILADDPSLTVKDTGRRAERQERGEPPNPARVVVDSSLRTSVDARVMDDAATTYLLASESAAPAAVGEMEAAGATVLQHGDDRVDLTASLNALQDQGIDRLLVEGGGEVVFSLFAGNLVDRLSVFIGSKIIGGRTAPTLADGDGFREDDIRSLELESVERLDDGLVLTYVC
ncbi:MAG: 2,5-diamino-6-(ribosylamino)-4(3H)-pyrimidinone 5'-phosphate reductase [Salinirussus sp.]